MTDSSTLESTPVVADIDCDEKLYEVINGQRKALEPMGVMQTVLVSELCYFLLHFAKERGLGLVVTETLFVLDAERNLQRRPDVAFVSYPRWPDKKVPSTAAWDVVPDLAVEVVSPSNSAEEIEAKVTEYFTVGVQAAWVLYPETGHLHVFDSPRGCMVIQRSEEVDGGAVLPGFKLQIERLFEAATRPD